MCKMPGHGHGHGHGHGYGHGGMGGHHGCCTFAGPSPHGCCCGGRGWRRFLSPAEEVARLEEYLGELHREIAGVEARLKELKGWHDHD